MLAGMHSLLIKRASTWAQFDGGRRWTCPPPPHFFTPGDKLCFVSPLFFYPNIMFFIIEYPFRCWMIRKTLLKKWYDTKIVYRLALSLRIVLSPYFPQQNCSRALRTSDFLRLSYYFLTGDSEEDFEVVFHGVLSNRFVLILQWWTQMPGSKAGVMPPHECHSQRTVSILKLNLLWNSHSYFSISTSTLKRTLVIFPFLKIFLLLF